MVAGYTKCRPRLNHTHHKFQNFRNFRPTINQVAEEDRLPAHECYDSMPSVVLLYRIAKGRHQFAQFIEATMNVTDDVKRPMLATPIGPHRLPHDFESVEFLWRLENVYATKPFSLQAPDRTS